jgi:hypothetical protein
MNFDIERNIHLSELHHQAALERMIPRISWRFRIARVLKNWGQLLEPSETPKTREVTHA